MAQPERDLSGDLAHRVALLEEEIRRLYERIALLENDNGALRQWVSKLEGDIVVFTRANEALHAHWREEMLKGSPLRGALLDRSTERLSVEGDERTADDAG